MERQALYNNFCSSYLHGVLDGSNSLDGMNEAIMLFRELPHPPSTIVGMLFPTFRYDVPIYIPDQFDFFYGGTDVTNAAQQFFVELVNRMPQELRDNKTVWSPEAFRSVFKPRTEKERLEEYGASQYRDHATSIVEAGDSVRKGVYDKAMEAYSNLDSHFREPFVVGGHEISSAFKATYNFLIALDFVTRGRTTNTEKLQRV